MISEFCHSAACRLLDTAYFLIEFMTSPKRLVGMLGPVFGPLVVEDAAHQHGVSGGEASADRVPHSSSKYRKYHFSGDIHRIVPRSLEYVAPRTGGQSSDQRLGRCQNHDTVVTHETESNHHQRLPAASCKAHHLTSFMQVTATNGSQRMPVATVLVQG
jgi:hypothetical protein